MSSHETWQKHTHGKVDIPDVRPGITLGNKKVFGNF
jgi:hypothetical protein